MTKSHVSASPRKVKPRMLYIVALITLSECCLPRRMLSIKRTHPILRRILVGLKERYTPIENVCLV